MRTTAWFAFLGNPTVEEYIDKMLCLNERDCSAHYEKAEDSNRSVTPENVQ